MERRPGFKPEELRPRYDVEAFQEDPWHSYSGRKTAEIVATQLAKTRTKSRLLMNAGAGVHSINISGWEEVSVDLFVTPLRSHPRRVCASIENLPFSTAEFGAVVCVGEVLGYCDPALAITEFARVLEPGGVLVCDFGNSRSGRYWGSATFGRAADLTTDMYNGSPERVWVYDFSYLESVLSATGFVIRRRWGTHTWSAFARRIGASPTTAVRWQQRLDWLPLPRNWADVTTILAVRCADAQE